MLVLVVESRRYCKSQDTAKTITSGGSGTTEPMTADTKLEGVVGREEKRVLGSAQ